jgi:predicted outer membrane repeat protein
MQLKRLSILLVLLTALLLTTSTLAQPANCAGLPVTGGTIPAGHYTLYAHCNIIDDLYVDATVAIDGRGHRIDLDHHTIFVTGTLTLNRVTIQNGGSRDGAIRNNPGGVLNVNHSRFIDNHADYSGGAIFNFEGTVSINKSMFRNNSAFYGGAILSDGVITIVDSQIMHNDAPYGGGFMNVNEGTQATIYGTRFIGNTGDIGGAIYLDNGTVSMAYTVFANNSALRAGGAVYAGWSADATLRCVHFGHNTPEDWSGVPIPANLPCGRR